MGYDAVVERCPSLCLIDLRGAAAPAAELLRGARLAPPAEPNRWLGHGETIVAWIGPRRWMIVAPMEREAELIDMVAKPVAGMSAVPVSDTLAVFSVSGPAAAEIVAQASPLDVHPRSFPEDGASLTAFFEQTALLLRRSGAFACLVDASYEDYFVDRFSRCHARLGPRLSEYRPGRA